jgi:hypothetical protein
MAVVEVVRRTRGRQIVTYTQTQTQNYARPQIRPPLGVVKSSTPSVAMKPAPVQIPIAVSTEKADAVFSEQFEVWREFLPLTIGVRLLLIKAAKQHKISKRAVRCALELHCSSARYLNNLAAAGAMRYALDGTPVEAVPEEDRNHALQLLNRKDQP